MNRATAVRVRDDLHLELMTATDDHGVYGKKSVARTSGADAACEQLQPWLCCVQAWLNKTCNPSTFLDQI